MCVLFREAWEAWWLLGGTGREQSGCGMGSSDEFEELDSDQIV